MRFARCYVDSPICTPSRARLLTGRGGPDHGVFRLHDILPDSAVLLPERLQDLGYTAALVGKLRVSAHGHEAAASGRREGEETGDHKPDTPPRGAGGFEQGGDRVSQTVTTAPLTSDEMAALRQLTTPTVANAIEVFDVQPRTTGFLHPTVRAVVTGETPMVGYACTAKMRASTAPSPDATSTRHQMWEHILSIPAPRVVVVEDLDEQPVGALWGEVQANIHQALGCTGVVTNGGVRDLDEVRALGFRFFAGSVMVSHAYAHVVEVGGPVTVGGMAVRPGDLLHGDQHGVAVVPQRIAAEVPRVAREIEAQERTIIDLCRSPEFSVARLDELFDAYR